MTSLRILVVSGTYPPDIGGAELSIHTGCKGLIQRGHKVVVIADDRRPAQEIYDEVPVIGVSPEKLKNEIEYQFSIHKFQVVITQLIYSPDALLWTKLQKIPSIYFVRNNEMHIDLSISSAYAPNILVASSKFLAIKSQEKWKRNVEVIYPFIDLKKTTPLRKRPIYLTAINPLVLKGGQLFYTLGEKFPEKEFLGVMGWTGLRKKSDFNWDPRQWELIAQAHGDSTVHPPEEIDFSALSNAKILKAIADMKTVYEKTRILLFPSQWQEAFGRSIVEALAAGIPVIATDVGGIRETGIDKGGFLLPKDCSIETWENSIRYIDKPEVYEKMSDYAKQDCSWYSLDEQLNALEKLCISLC